MAKKIIAASKLGINNQMINEDAMHVIQKLQENSFDGYIVGGGIRDLLLKKTPKDFDVVTNATPEQVRKIFKRNSIIIGKRFKIIHVIFSHLNYDKLVNNRPINERHIIEISTYRSLKVHKNSINEFGKIMVDNNYGSQSDDALRRDFTINALYYDPVNETIVDYHDGIKDLKNNSLRMIGNPAKRYVEDPVRVLRAIRLSVKLGLTIEDKTLKELNIFKDLLLNENRNRLFEEMLKILLSGSSNACIEQIIKFKLPYGIFPLFDKIFMGKIKDQVALKILKKTDERIQSNNDVSAVFILSGLMWNMVYKQWQKMILNGGSPTQTLYDAIQFNRAYANTVGITKNMFSAMSDVWLLQLEFENPIPKKLSRVMSSSRFRQGLHLYNIRHELNEVDSELNTWWNKFIELDSNEEKISYIESLNNVHNPKQTKNKKSKKRKTKK